mmetsp:Transcript_4674/g.12610  ORF Transcript_4674/g.12610 Transcript_4674/m.12610 type:complete len:222 (-) Transcript_4674:667-1332(-)
MAPATTAETSTPRAARAAASSPSNSSCSLRASSIASALSISTSGACAATKLIEYTYVNTAISSWQSIRSVTPPWPGMRSAKSFTPNARFKPEAKKPPNGAITDANSASASACSWIGASFNVGSDSVSDTRCTSSCPGGIDSRAGVNSGGRAHCTRQSSAAQSENERFGQYSIGSGSDGRESRNAAAEATTRVANAPPRKPSTVLLGESATSGVLPKRRPTR